MTNLITKTSIRITSKEVLVRQRDNVDAREKQVQEEKTASETVHSHPSKGMETGSEEDLSGNSSSRSDNERGLDEDLVGGDFQDTEGSSGGFDFIPTVLPANCIPGSKRVKQVQQSVSSSIFNMETNMTIDGKYNPCLCTVSPYALYYIHPFTVELFFYEHYISYFALFFHLFVSKVCFR